jgi:hypothetical protein
VHEGNHTGGLRRQRGGVRSGGSRWREMAMRRKYPPWCGTTIGDKDNWPAWAHT